MASEDTIIYQSDQCVISSSENETPRSNTSKDDISKLPRSINLADEKLKTIRVNIKMVIRCPSVVGTIAPPSTPVTQSASLKDYRSTPEEEKIIPSNATKKLIISKRTTQAKSAPPKTIGSAFRKSEKHSSSYRMLSSKTPSRYLSGTSSNNGRRGNNTEKVVLRPFSERQKSNASALCFTYHRNLSTGQNVKYNGAEFGSFVGKRPLTYFNRLGCYTSQLKTTNIKFPGRPESAKSEMIEQNLKPPQQKQHHHTSFRRTLNVEAKTHLAPTNKEPIASENAESKVRTRTNSHGNISSTKQFGYVFVKRKEGCITTSNQLENIQKTQAEKLIIEKPVNNMRFSKNQVVPFRRIFNSTKSSSGRRSIARNSSYQHRCENNASKKNLNAHFEYLAYQNRRLLPTRIHLTPFQLRDKIT